LEGPADQRRYEFLHDLYRTAAFERSLHGRRRGWYQRIAEKMLADSGNRTDEMATELAYYFEQANMPIEAARYCALAGEKAARRFADSEALAQFRHGIEMLNALPESNDRDAIELRLQVGLALPLLNRQGYGTEEAVAVVSRATELNEKLGDGPQSFAALRGLYQILTGKADYEGVLALCDRMDRVAQRDPDPYTLAEAIRLRAVAAFWLGRLAESQEALIRSIRVSSTAEGSSKVLAVVEDIGATALAILALVQWMLGYPDQAARSAEEAVANAVTLGAPFSIVIVRCFRAMLMRFLRDPVATLEEADSAIAICEQHGFGHWRGQASLERGWAMTMQGRGAAGIQEIRRALASAPLGLGGSIAKLADACLHVGRTNEGLRSVDEALDFVQAHKEASWEPELHRLKGELLLQSAGRKKDRKAHQRELEKAEASFLKSIDCARRNGAKSFELRAAMSLCRLWRKGSKREKGRQLLQEVYGWFTEGYETPDLLDARKLLEKSN
jgi:tetratricopeptide (TPR) repeat protein